MYFSRVNSLLEVRRSLSRLFEGEGDGFYCEPSTKVKFLVGVCKNVLK
jgi:hypothetical protein